MKKILILIGAMSIVACSSTIPNAGNYTTVMNQPNVKSGNQVDVSTTKLNQQAWRDLEVSHATSILVDKSGNMIPHGATGEGYLFIRANIVNEGNTPTQANWRCKFYNSAGLVIGDDENDQVADKFNKTGLGWHSMVVYPVASSIHTDEANLIRCVAPSKLATQFKIEVHDRANDVTLYN